MRNLRSLLLVLVTIFLFWFIKLYIKFPSAEIEVIGIILTATSILFGFLAGFFISELWSRYVEIRSLQGERSSAGVTMIDYAENFYTDKKFESEFKSLVEKSAVVDEVINWNEGHLEVPYFQDIQKSFKLIKIKKSKDDVYFDKLLDNYQEYAKLTIRLDALYKDRLFKSEWLMLSALSIIIAASILLLDVSHPFYQIIVLIFPAIMAGALLIIYDLDSLAWSKEIITLEPNERIFDALGVKRFYLKKRRPYLSKWVKDYRTEDDIEGELKDAYLDILSARKN